MYLVDSGNLDGVGQFGRRACRLRRDLPRATGVERWPAPEVPTKVLQQQGERLTVKGCGCTGCLLFFIAIGIAAGVGSAAAAYWEPVGTFVTVVTFVVLVVAWALARDLVDTLVSNFVEKYRQG